MCKNNNKKISISGEHPQPNGERRSEQLRSQWRVGPDRHQAGAQRRLLPLLSGALSRCDHHPGDSPEDTVLPVQRHSALHYDVRPYAARLLPAARVGREDRPRRHRPPRFLRLHVGHLGEAAGNLRVNSSAW